VLLQVKPVRDTVHDAIQLWKTLTGTEPELLESAGQAGNSISYEKNFPFKLILMTVIRNVI
jgi:hypothetical protein